MGLSVRSWTSRGFDIVLQRKVTGRCALHDGCCVAPPYAGRGAGRLTAFAG